MSVNKEAASRNLYPYSSDFGRVPIGFVISHIKITSK
jgi:hypothetical protein